MIKEGGKRKVLFICTHNAARSQLGEGLMRDLYGESFEVHSAGVSPLGVHPFAIRVLQEVGIDISDQWSKSITEFAGWNFDFVVTLCDDAKQNCPFFPGKVNIHRGFDDPVVTQGPNEDMLGAFRRVCKEIKDWIVSRFGDL